MIIFDTHTALGSARRSGTPSYSSTNLNSYKGLKNDSWSSISNTSELQSYIGSYIFFEVNVSDTSKLARYILKLNSISGTTIYTDNIGWGYDGSTEWNWSVGKIPSEYGDYKPIENIVYNGTSLTSLVYNGTEVWSKASWHTVWTGTASTSSFRGTSFALKTVTVSGLKSGVKARVTGYVNSTSYPFTAVDSFDNINSCWMKSLVADNTTRLTLQARTDSSNTQRTIYITKVEQYY